MIVTPITMGHNPWEGIDGLSKATWPPASELTSQAGQFLMKAAERIGVTFPVQATYDLVREIAGI
ncbi:MAG TPA: hypothetical protein VEV41_04905 [Terriglobales bacterium]|nr:hypothetical protein [Terriglobales bacterium]